MAEKAGHQEKVEPNYDAFLRHVGDRIRAARRKAGMTQSDLARSIGAKQPYIVAVEAGENLTLRSLARICAMLDVEPVALLSDKEIPLACHTGLSDQETELIGRVAHDTDQLSKLLVQLQSALSEPRPPGAKPKKQN